MGEASVQYELGTSIIQSKDVMSRLLNSEIHDSFGGLQLAAERARSGIGTVALFSHNSINDGLAVISTLRQAPEFSQKEIIVPMSSILYERGYRFAEKPLGIKIFPIDSPEVRKKKGQEINPTGKLLQYLRASKNALEQGGCCSIGSTSARQSRYARSCWSARKSLFSVVAFRD